jgi:CheY-like chemotaxis protein
MADDMETPLDAKTAEPLKTLLLAEDDPATQTLCRAGLRNLTGYQVVIVGNGLEALEVLKHQVVNVIVTDLYMPEMDGYQLISIVNERYPNIPILVMTGLAETTHQNAPIFLGALGVISKPVKLSTLMEQIRDAGNRKPDGVIKGIQLNGLLQLMQWERKSCTITIQSPDGIGMLYVQDGDLIHALFKDTEGLDAAYRILALPSAHVEFTDVCRVNRTINTPLTELLLNLAMKKDLDKGN